LTSDLQAELAQRKAEIIEFLKASQAQTIVRSIVASRFAQALSRFPSGRSAVISIKWIAEFGL
jgi:hypothetical protein